MSNASVRGLIAILIVVVSLSPIAGAAVREVPGAYPTIQNAIASSASGDVILVSPGVYNENVNFGGKAITVSSTNPADLNVVSNTVIHAVGKRSAVTFANRESARSVLTGFTITGGYGTINNTFDNTVY